MSEVVVKVQNWIGVIVLLWQKTTVHLRIKGGQYGMGWMGWMVHLKSLIGRKIYLSSKGLEAKVRRWRVGHCVIAADWTQHMEFTKIVTSWWLYSGYGLKFPKVWHLALAACRRRHWMNEFVLRLATRVLEKRRVLGRSTCLRKYGIGWLGILWRLKLRDVERVGGGE